MPRPFSVLLAEDDAPLRCCLAEVLSSNGWWVHSVETGPRAVQVARSVRLDFSILDMHLPGMTGLEVFRTIDAEVGGVPAILMSGQASREDTAAAVALGFYTFLRKPLELGAFRHSLDRLVRHYFGVPRPPEARPPEPRLPGPRPPELR